MSKLTRQQFLDEFGKGTPRTRKTTARLVEGKVDQDGAAFVQEVMNFVGPDLTVRQVDVISSRTCSSGHLQDQHTKLTGVCEVCGAITCSVVGCGYTCTRCGKALCRRHAYPYGENEVYCPRCRPWKWLRLFLGL